MTDFGEPPVAVLPIEIKALVRHRDGYRCAECGMSAAEHVLKCSRNLDVHRIVPGSKYTVAGCVTLCRKCHKGKPKSPRGSRGHTNTVVRLDSRTLADIAFLRKHLADIPSRPRSVADVLRIAVHRLAKERGLVSR